MIKESRVPKFGEQIIGEDYTDNPETDAEKVTAKFIEIAEILKESYQNNPRFATKSLLFDHTVGELVNAHLNVIKLINTKHFTEE
jgi:hypothetical protein